MTTLHIREQAEDVFFTGASVDGVLKQTVMRHMHGKYGCPIWLLCLTVL